MVFLFKSNRKPNMDGEELLEWIHNQTILDEETGCRIWTKCCDKEGYGQTSYKRIATKAHRLVYQLSNPVEVIDGFEVMHSCDNPSCVRLDCLSLGTSQDNIKDKVNKGRQAKGEKNGRAKLTEDDVKEIRRRYKKIKGQQTRLAKEFGISRKQIRSIVNNKLWKSLL